MRIIMFGTGPFAVPTFKELLASRHEVPMLVTRPVTNSGNRRKSAENPTRDAGEEAGIEIYEPPSINTEDAIQKLTQYHADLFVVCDYGQILSNRCLEAARYGGINLHGSLLPRYRGAAPINWAIFHGESVLGITVIHMTSRLDAGNSITTASLELQHDDTAETVEPRLAELGVKPVMKAIELIEQWDETSTLGTPQDPALATKAPRLNKKDGLIDWNRSAKEIRCQIMAFQPWPGTYCQWSPPGKPPMRLIVHRASVVEGPEVKGANVEPGCVAIANDQTLVVQTGHAGLALDRIQPAGKKAMPIADFLRGYRPQPGDSFRVE